MIEHVSQTGDLFCLVAITAVVILYFCAALCSNSNVPMTSISLMTFMTYRKRRWHSQTYHGRVRYKDYHLQVSNLTHITIYVIIRNTSYGKHYATIMLHIPVRI